MKKLLVGCMMLLAHGFIFSSDESYTFNVDIKKNKKKDTEKYIINSVSFLSDNLENAARECLNQTNNFFDEYGLQFEDVKSTKNYS